MGVIVDDIQIMHCINQIDPISATIDLDEADKLSVGINVTDSTGSNLLEFQESVDGINYATVCSLNITATGTTIWHIYPVFSRWKRIFYVPGTGAATFTVHINVRVDNIGASGEGTHIVMGNV